MLHELTLTEAAAQVRTGQVSPVDLVRAMLDRIERLDGTLTSFITVTAEAALAEAQRAEAQAALGGALGPLHGVPIALKDLFDTAGVRTTGGSKILADRVPDADAGVVARLRMAGAIVLGKLNMHEFAFGVTTDNPHFGRCNNPWNVGHTPGGSSGGSGAAVAAALCYASLGSDTGGSIRIPASYCGIVGLKPTYGRVGRGGVLPLAWSLDNAGPMAKTVRDTALLMNVIAGYDDRDPASANTPVPDYLADLDGGVRQPADRRPPRLVLRARGAGRRRGRRGGARPVPRGGAEVRDVAIPTSTSPRRRSR
ncbi:MAG: amidase [Dehalococcoidia bacterium]